MHPCSLYLEVGVRTFRFNLDESEELKMPGPGQVNWEPEVSRHETSTRTGHNHLLVFEKFYK